MKHRLFLLIAIMGALAIGCQQEPAQTGTMNYEEAEREIRSVIAAQVDGWNSGSVEEFMRGYWKSDSLRFAGRGTVTYGWDSTLAKYRRGFPTPEAMGKLTFSEIDVDFIDAGHALVLGRWSADHDSLVRGGLYTLVFKSFDEGWRIVHDHTSIGPEVKKEPAD